MKTTKDILNERHKLVNPLDHYGTLKKLEDNDNNKYWELSDVEQLQEEIEERIDRLTGYTNPEKLHLIHEFRIIFNNFKGSD